MSDQPTQPEWGPPPQQPPPQRPAGEWGAPPPPKPPTDKPPTDKPPWWRRTWVVATGTFFLGAIIGTAGANDQPQVQVRTVTVTSIVTSLVTPATTVGVTTTAPATTRAPVTTAAPREWTEGIYEVGREIPVGTYKTSGGGGDNCYYARLRSDATTDIIANNNSTGPMTMRVRPTDKFVEFAGGCTWRKV